MERYYFTSEAVTEGHPDKICDKIADKILDTVLKIDKESKMAVEATVKDNLVFIYGEAKTNAKLDYEEIALNVITRLADQPSSEQYLLMKKIWNTVDKAIENGNENPNGNV